MNVRLMLDDSARSIKTNNTDDDTGGTGGKVIHRELKTNEDIKNYVKGIL